jgi:hypothetical protein
MTTQKFMGKHQLVDRLAAQVGSHELARHILQKRGQMRSDGTLTEEGRARDAMTAEERAKDRASKREGRPASDFSYNRLTNTARRR